MKKLFVPLSVLLLFACDSSKKMTESASGTAQSQGKTIDLDYMNLDARAQDDFFEFCNGNWVKNNPVPPSESRWGSFNELEESNNEKLTALLEEAKSAKAAKGSMTQILGDYYASFIDMEKRDAVGVKGIEKDLKAIEAIKSKSELASILANHHSLGINSLFRFGVGQDLKNVDRHVVYMSQGGIGLPNREYYFDPSKKQILDRYRLHIIMSFHNVGIDRRQGETISESIIQFESTLAESMMTPAELRDPEKTYNPTSLNDLTNELQVLDFEQYLKLIKIGTVDKVIVGQPAFVSTVSRMVDEIDLESWKHYLTWKVINHYTKHLDSASVQLHFDFYSKELSGKTEMKPLNEQAISAITRLEFGELLGKAFVSKHYSDEAQQRINTMVDNLVVVFEERIQNLDWMSKTTKKEALNKLSSIGRKLGFPSKWEDYSALNFNADNYLENVREIARFSYQKNLKKLHEPVDKDKWGMPAHMVNAYYHPLLNEIAFPAGIMQEPFFSVEYEDAVNYGRIGMVIGHELTHGFDDKGSKFSADGSFTNWWSKEDRESFVARTKKLGNTFSHFCPVDDGCVNPELTMGENIADLGGLTLAYHAYKRTPEFKKGLTVKGYTPSQRFFIAYAQLWKINYTEEELKNRLANDSHSPGMYRVNGPLMNCPEFFEAFNVKEGDPMRNPEDKIAKIW